MTEVTFGVDTEAVKHELTILVLALLGLAAAALAIDPGGFGIGVLIGIPIFGGIKVWRLIGYLRHPDLVTLDARGITDQSYGLGFIPWSNVRAARLKEQRRLLRTYQVIELELIDEGAFFVEGGRDRELIRRGQSQGITGIWINTWQLTEPPEQVLQAIRVRL